MGVFLGDDEKKEQRVQFGRGWMGINMSTTSIGIFGGFYLFIYSGFGTEKGGDGPIWEEPEMNALKRHRDCFLLHTLQ